MSDDGEKKPTTRRQKPKVGRARGRVLTNTPDSNEVISLFGDKPGKGHVPVPPGGTQEEKKDRSRESRSRRGYISPGLRWSNIIAEVKRGEYTWEEFAQSLSPEELARGQLKDKNGTFTGRPPALVPQAFFRACTRELMKQGAQLWKENYVKAIQTMTEISNDPKVKPADRIKAAQFVIERLEGKVPERLEVTVGDPWQEAIEGILTDIEDTKIAAAGVYLARENAEKELSEQGE